MNPVGPEIKMALKFLDKYLLCSISSSSKSSSNNEHYNLCQFSLLIYVHTKIKTLHIRESIKFYF